MRSRTSRTNTRSLPFKGEGRGEDGVSYRAPLTPSSPFPLLEGEGIFWSALSRGDDQKPGKHQGPGWAGVGRGEDGVSARGPLTPSSPVPSH